jgi:hypothetical protein
MGIHKGKITIIALVALLVIQPVTVAALSSGEAKQDWRAAKDPTYLPSNTIIFFCYGMPLKMIPVENEDLDCISL